jgi:hypothetical protein
MCIDKITFNSDHIDFDKENHETFMKSHLTNQYNEIVMDIYSGYYNSFLHETNGNNDNNSSQNTYSNFEFNFRVGEPILITDENEIIIESSDSDETETYTSEETNESGLESFISEENNETMIYPS